MKVGDLVMVTFGRGSAATVGIFVCDDTNATGYDKDGFRVITRGFVLWDGDIFSTPIDQIEVVNESR
jgi:S-adenosylhomocysteine hydrolase